MPKQQNSNSFVVAVLLCFITLLSTCAYANNDEKTLAEQRLQNVKQKIKQQQKQIKKQKSQLGKVETEVKNTDKQIAQAIKTLRQTQQQLGELNTALSQLQQEKQQTEKEKAKQTDVLAMQVKSAYHLGHHDYLMLLLSQESPGKLERMLSYYQYLNEARVDVVEKLKNSMQKLADIEQQQQQKKQQLLTLKQTQTQNKQALAKLKQKQVKTLKALNAQLNSDRKQLKRFKGNENELNSLIEALSKTIEALPDLDSLEGLKKYKGKLPWPTNGNVQRLYGTKKRGPLKWKGIRINNKLGQAVRNIHAGQVIFSDWMKGFGLVLVVDHGEGYMSLYGHNQTLLKNIGDIVEAGETVALVGQSGGQPNPNLYFEIRYKGRPLNPVYWCK